VVTGATAESPPVVAVTVDAAADAGAVNRPAVDTVPPPVTLHVNAGCVESGMPNWSVAIAENCCVAAGASVAVPGVSVTAVAVWPTVTTTVEVAVRPSVSRSVATIA
jgi:hypothetical protein